MRRGESADRSLLPPESKRANSEVCPHPRTGGFVWRRLKTWQTCIQHQRSRLAHSGTVDVLTSIAPSSICVSLFFFLPSSLPPTSTLSASISKPHAEPLHIYARGPSLVPSPTFPPTWPMYLTFVGRAMQGSPQIHSEKDTKDGASGLGRGLLPAARTTSSLLARFRQICKIAGVSGNDASFPN